MNGIKPSNYNGDYTVTTVPAPKSDICPQCGKPVKGAAVCVVPPTLEIQLGTAAVKMFHPACYRKAELEGQNP